MRHVIVAGVLASVCRGGFLPAEEVRLTPATVAHFATVEEGGRVLGTRDQFVSRMSPFDRAVRLQSDQPVSEERFLKWAAGSTRAWEPEEVERITRAFSAIRPALKSLKVNLPKLVLIIKSADGDAGAAYTRATAVVLPASMVADSRTNWRELLAHELLHILTRHNPRLRRSLYATIGFHPCNEIELPGGLRARKITNPDAPWNDSYIVVSVDGHPTAVVPVLFSKEEKYDRIKGGGLFRYLTFRLLAVEEDKGQWKPKYHDGEPILLDVGQVWNFHEQVGRNTGYVIHPEEIVADNFARLVTGRENVPSPEILRKLRQVLSAERSTAPEPFEPGPPAP